MAVSISNDFLSPLSIASCLFTSKKSRPVLEDSLKKLLSIDSIYLTSSGTHALKVIFSALKKVSKKRFIAIAAYSCPDIAVAAILSGFEVYALEIDQGTLEPIFPSTSISDDFAAVVLSNLFGLPDNIDYWRSSLSDDTLILDDACQSYLSRRNAIHVGAENGTIGAISFARGKPLAGVGGGAIISGKKSSNSSKLLLSVGNELETMQLHTNKRRGFLHPFITSLINWTVTQPAIFSLILKTPLDLGKPSCRREIAQTLPSDFEIGYSLKQLLNTKNLHAHILNNITLWKHSLDRLKVTQPLALRNFSKLEDVIAIRYPVILASEQEAHETLHRLRKIGIGATTGYRRTLQEWKNLSPYISTENDTPIAKEVSRKLLLLPTHSQVKESDILSAIRFFPNS